MTPAAARLMQGLSPADRAGQLGAHEPRPIGGARWGRASTLAKTGRCGPPELGVGDGLAQAIAGRRHERCVEGTAHLDGHGPLGAERLRLGGGRFETRRVRRRSRPGPGRCSSATQTSPSTHGHAISTWSSSSPRIAYMVPCWASAAACMALPRSVTSRTPSSNPMHPGGGERRVLAQTVTGVEGGLDTGSFDGVEHDHAHDERRELGVAGLDQLVLRRRRAGVVRVSARDLAGLGHEFPRGMILPGSAHSGLLRSLAREGERDHDRNSLVGWTTLSPIRFRKHVIRDTRAIVCPSGATTAVTSG